MLKHLLIENYALIDKLDVEFGKGLTAITGETGAGKSILLGALALILGQRADTRVLQDKSRKCIIEGSFRIGDLGLRDLFEKFDLDYDETSLFRREITPKGKSRAFINDTPVTLQTMKALSERLIDIHSQHESLLVGTSGFQFKVVDGYAGVLEMLDDYRARYQEYIQLLNRLAEMEEEERAAKADLDYYRFQFDELEKARLDPQEYAGLEEELGIRKHAEDILMKLEHALYILQESDLNAADKLSEATALYRSLAQYSNSYEQVADRLESVLIEIKDIAGETDRLKEGVVHDPGQVALLESRLDQVNKLMLKHSADDMESLLETKARYQAKIEASESLETQILKLRESVEQKKTGLELLAEQLHSKRAEAIPKIQQEVTDMLRNLAMPHARFIIEQKKLDKPGQYGFDDLTFLFNANRGGELQDVAKVASGGELSRFMLAIKSMISSKNFLPTIIFDEIDTGISGETSTRVASILDSISARMQVISITHLPQIAARGKDHLLVFKKTEKSKTFTYIKQLNKDERITELAKMLGGEKPTKTMVETAKELIFNHRN